MRRRRRTGRRDSGYERQINEDEGEGEDEDEDSTTPKTTPERTSEEEDDEEIRSDKQLQEKEAMTETETEDVEEGESEDVQHQREEVEEEGDNRIDPKWRPSYVEKPGMRLTWIQVRFALLMFLMYSIIITGICLTSLAANDIS